MKLLRDFFRLRPAGIDGAVDRKLATPHDFSVTVPAPLAGQGVAQSAMVELPGTRTVRREPASFMLTSRRRRFVSG
ncbi:MAG: hypothetical protein ABI386_13495, partial [Rhodanobacter sp.]